MRKTASFATTAISLATLLAAGAMVPTVAGAAETGAIVDYLYTL